MAKRNKRPPLTRRRQLWAQRRGTHVFYGKPLVPNAGVADRYAQKLLRQINAMADETEREVQALYRRNRPAVTTGLDASMASQARILMNQMARRFEVVFRRLAPGLAKQTLAGINRASASNLHASLRDVSGGLSLKTSVITGRVREVMTASTAENVALIKSIPAQYFEKIQGTIMRAITAGRGAADVFDMVEHIGAVTRKRAKLIARDQTSKATTALNAARMDDLGITEFEWLHSAAGKEPRPLHKNVLDGNVYRLDNLPIIDEKTGERGLPGQLINCRCRMVPVIKFGANS